MSFFWALYHSALVPTINIGAIWPPEGIETLDPLTTALFNTLTLLLSGVTVTWAHYGLLKGNREETIIALLLTIFLGLLFTGAQAFEYKMAGFYINDGAYGSTFFLITGFHGFHVIVGTILLIVSLVRHINYNFTTRHFLGFEAAA